MNAEPVIEKILADARAEAEKIKNQAKTKLSQEQLGLDEKLREYHKQTDELVQKAGTEARSKVLSNVRMELAKEMLVEKTKILDEVFSLAEQKIKSMPDEQYQAMMTKLILDSALTGDEEVIIDTGEKRIDQKLIDGVNKQLASKGNLKLSNDRQPITAGFILKKGKIKNNCSLQVLLSRAKTELDMELAKQLFSD